MRAWWMVLVVVAGCSKSSPDCERAVGHVVDLISNAGPPESKPHADEQAVIDQIRTSTITQCAKEGLSPAQRDCILAAKSLMDKTFLSCPALVAKPPTWIHAPIGHPEAVDELEKLRANPPPPAILDEPAPDAR